MKILIKNARLVTSREIVKADLLVQSGKIAKISKSISENADKEIDASGKHVFAGFIDLHTHLRSPGAEHKEDFLSGSKAAVKGGFTKIFCMPNTEPPIDNEGLAAWVVQEGKKVGLLDIYPIGAITKGRQGRELAGFNFLKKAGCIFLSDDGASVLDALVFRKALEYADMCGLTLVSHCEDSRLSGRGVIREGFISSKYGVAGVPDICESLIVSRDIELAKYLDTKIHLAHISTAKSIEIIRRAKKEGVKVTCETAPHYFILTVDDVEKSGFDSNFKVNPPLGFLKDIKAVQKALNEGIIDCIATDHAPHSKAEKELPFEDAPFGFTGLELAFSLTYTYLVKKGAIDLKEAAKKLSENPARISGFNDCGRIEEGCVADLVIIDLDKKWQPTHENLASKSKNTPFLGCELEGVIEYTINKGKVVYENSKL